MVIVVLEVLAGLSAGLVPFVVVGVVFMAWDSVTTRRQERRALALEHYRAQAALRDVKRTTIAALPDVEASARAEGTVLEQVVRELMNRSRG